MKKYYNEYEWSNIFAMLHNQRGPEICTDDFKGRLVVISGATSGIGSVTAKKYASCGADILCINRNEARSEELCAAIESAYHTQCSYILADFSKLSDVHTAAKQLSELDADIDVLIHNAGLYSTTKKITADNLELVFQTNYLSSFIINHYNKDKLIAQKNGRIIFVNSEAHRFAAWGLKLDDLSWDNQRYSGLKSYGNAKLAQLLSMIKFNAYFSNSGATINAMHPGNVRTNSGQNNGWLYKIFKRVIIDRTAKAIDISAEALYYLGVSDEVKNISGKFFNLTTEEEPAPPALDREASEELWAISMEMGQLI